MKAWLGPAEPELWVKFWPGLAGRGMRGGFGLLGSCSEANGKTPELAYYRCYSPTPVTPREHVRVAGWRRKVEGPLHAVADLPAWSR